MITGCIDRRRLEQENRSRLKATLEAISTELELLFSRYKKTMGSIITGLSSDQVLNMYYSVTENYFTMFDNNAKLLGQLKNKELRNAIISTYINIKGLIEGFKINNWRMRDYEIFLSYDIAGTNPSLIQKNFRKLCASGRNLLTR